MATRLATAPDGPTSRLSQTPEPPLGDRHTPLVEVGVDQTNSPDLSVRAMLLLVVTILASLTGAAVLGLVCQPRDADPELQAVKRRSSRGAWGIVLVLSLFLFVGLWVVTEAIRQIPWS